jgi:hypothetical protein
MSNVKVKKLDGIVECSRLKLLNINETLIEDISELYNCKELDSLYIYI